MIVKFIKKKEIFKVRVIISTIIIQKIARLMRGPPNFALDTVGDLRLPYG